MKVFTKVGIAVLTSGIFLSSVGGIIYAIKPPTIEFGNQISYTKNFDDNIDEIDIEIAFSNIEIIAGDEFKLVAENVPENFDVEITESDDKLCIETKQDIEMISIDGNFNIYNDIDGKYILYIPEKEMDKLIIETAFSNLNISSVKTDTLDIESAFGEYTLTDIECDKLIVETAFSDSTINNTVCEKADISNGFGNIDSENLKITDSGDFENAFGSINIKLDGDNYNFDTVDSIGSTQTFNSPEKDVNIDISTSFGDTLFKN